LGNEEWRVRGLANAMKIQKKKEYLQPNGLKIDFGTKFSK